MALLKKLKSLLGLEEEQSSSDRREDDTVGVTVEHDRGDDRSASEPASTAETEPEGPPIDPGPDSGSIEEEPAGAETESAVDPEEAPPGTDAPGTETAEPAPAETGDSAEEGAVVDGTVDVEPAVDSPEPGEGLESETEPEAEPGSEDEIETEPEVEDSTADEGGSTDEELQDIKGIGPSYETKLSEAGVETVDELADADAEELADDTGLSTKRIRGWIERARSR